MKTIKEIQIRTRRRSIVASGREPYGKPVKSPDCVASICAALLEGIDQEVFLAFVLDVRNKVMGYQEVHRGGVDMCMAEPALIFRAAVIQGATSVIVAHNHPSGDPAPSTEDIALTKRLAKAGEVLGIQLLDHVIIGETDHVSMQERGLV